MSTAGSMNSPYHSSVDSEERSPSIAVVIPCYRVVAQVAMVIAGIGDEVERIFCVDDGCPDGSGAFIEKEVEDSRVVVLYHEKNQGVGAATMSGYRAAIDWGADIIVKLDGDGQMAPELIPRIIRPIVEGDADYTKGNRFHDLEGVRQMPMVRLFGNALLSFMSKLSTGYWNLFDPTNGFTAIHTKVAQELPFEKISKGYFYETDMLFRLNIVSAVVTDIPMRARYGNEKSNLRIGRIIPRFLFGHLRNTLKRILYNYFLRGFSAGSLELLLALALVPGGILFGLSQWGRSIETGVEATAGTVFLAALPIILGMQLLLSFLAEDINSVPSVPLHKRL